VSRAKSKVAPHPFVPDPDVPPDHNGRGACAMPGCHLIGEPNDAHHTLPVVPEQAAHERRYGDDTHDGGDQ
jgi:hypothetical protein